MENFQDYVDSDSGKVRIVVTQGDSGWYFLPSKDRKNKGRKIIHSEVLSEFAPEPLKPRKDGKRVIAWRSGYTLPVEAVSALIDEEAYRQWQAFRYLYLERQLQHQLRPGSNGNNSFVKHQIAQLGGTP